VAMCLVACEADKQIEVNVADKLGSDRDKHGCIGSAGYLWCEHTSQCERPWELAEREGIEKSQEQFDSYCSRSPL